MPDPSMTTKDFIKKWGKKARGSFWLKDAGRCYYAAAYTMMPLDRLAMSEDFMALRNFDSYRGSPASNMAWDVISRWASTPQEKKAFLKRIHNA